MANPFYDYFGSDPNTVILRTSDNFNGTPVTDVTTGDIKTGVITFPIQAGGGLIDFHTRPLVVHNIASSAYPITASVVYAAGIETIVAELTTTNKAITEEFMLPVGAKLKIVGTGGAGSVAITAAEYIQGNAL
jgi:hypothetical protein